MDIESAPPTDPDRHRLRIRRPAGTDLRTGKARMRLEADGAYLVSYLSPWPNRPTSLASLKKVYPFFESNIFE